MAFLFSVMGFSGPRVQLFYKPSCSDCIASYTNHLHGKILVMKNLLTVSLLVLSLAAAQAQVDTSYVYNTSMPYGTLDIRIAKSSSRYYYLQEDNTISFRESSPGVKTNTFRDMTSWNSAPYGQGNLREKSGTADYFIMNYRLLFPVGYQPNYSEGYPMIVMLHPLTLHIM